MATSLPRYIHILALDESRQFLTLADFAGGLLTFTSAEPNHMTVHEVVRPGPEGAAFMIRSENGKLWRRRADGFMVADAQDVEQATYFLPLALPNAITVLQTTDDQLYLRRFVAHGIDGYRATTAGLDIHSHMLVLAADDMLLTLPPRIALLALDESRRFLVNPDTRRGGAVTFTGEAMSRSTAHEVVKSPLNDGTVMIRSPDGLFWRRRDDGFIFADRSSTPDTADKECFFKAVRFQSVTVLMSMLDGRYLKRFSTNALPNGYNAETATIDRHCQMLVIALAA